MPFQFVDNNAPIGRAARKNIRSHVAIGKNAGKTLVRRSRTKAFVLKPHIPSTFEIPCQIGDGLSGICIPTTLSPRFRPIVQKSLSFFMAPRHVPELNSVLSDNGYTTSMWVQSIFLDEAYFHSAIAMAVTAMNNLVSRPYDVTEALNHASQALQIFSKRLSGQDAASDANMAVVVAMTQFERHQGEYRRGAVHLNGLLQMVELRGGISLLTEYKPSLTQKLFRADLEFALYLGTETRFSIKDVMLGTTAILGSQKDNQREFVIANTPLFGNLGAELQELLLDIIAIAEELNIISAEKRQKLNNYAFHDTIILIGYRLIHISPLGGSVSCLSNLVHLGLAAFLLTFLRRLDYKVSEMPLLYKVTSSAVQQLGNEDSSHELLIWMLFIGNASIFTHADDIWLLPIVQRAMIALDLHTWQDVHHILIKWPWVNILHNKHGEALCDRSSLNMSRLHPTPT